MLQASRVPDHAIASWTVEIYYYPKANTSTTAKLIQGHPGLSHPPCMGNGLVKKNISAKNSLCASQ